MESIKIGEPEREHEIEVAPAEEPLTVPKPAEVPDPAPVEVPDPVKVPA